MSKKAPAKKKTAKKAQEATPAAPAADDTQAPITTDEQAQAAIAAEVEQATAAAEEQTPAAPAAEPAPVSETVLVKVGPNGSAGRIVLGRAVYDSKTPQLMCRSDFERLKAQYDLQEVKD